MAENAEPIDQQKFLEELNKVVAEVGGKAKMRVSDLIQIRMIFDGDKTKGWVYTIGLARLNLPELEIRGVNPIFLMPEAGILLNHVSQYMWEMQGTENEVKLGATMGVSRFQKFRFVKLDPIEGEEHAYKVERWSIEALPMVCESPCCKHKH